MTLCASDVKNTLRKHTKSWTANGGLSYAELAHYIAGDTCMGIRTAELKSIVYSMLRGGEIDAVRVERGYDGVDALLYLSRGKRPASCPARRRGNEAA